MDPEQGLPDPFDRGGHQVLDHDGFSDAPPPRSNVFGVRPRGGQPRYGLRAAGAFLLIPLLLIGVPYLLYRLSSEDAPEPEYAGDVPSWVNGAFMLDAAVPVVDIPVSATREGIEIDVVDELEIEIELTSYTLPLSTAARTGDSPDAPVTHRFVDGAEGGDGVARFELPDLDAAPVLVSWEIGSDFVSDRAPNDLDVDSPPGATGPEPDHVFVPRSGPERAPMAIERWTITASDGTSGGLVTQRSIDSENGFADATWFLIDDEGRTSASSDGPLEGARLAPPTDCGPGGCTFDTWIVGYPSGPSGTLHVFLEPGVSMTSERVALVPTILPMTNAIEVDSATGIRTQLSLTDRVPGDPVSDALTTFVIHADPDAPEGTFEIEVAESVGTSLSRGALVPDQVLCCGPISLSGQVSAAGPVDFSARAVAWGPERVSATPELGV